MIGQVMTFEGTPDDNVAQVRERSAQAPDRQRPAPVTVEEWDVYALAP